MHASSSNTGDLPLISQNQDLPYKVSFMMWLEVIFQRRVMLRQETLEQKRIRLHLEYQAYRVLPWPGYEYAGGGPCGGGRQPKSCSP